jgi:hypothetical protein
MLKISLCSLQSLSFILNYAIYLCKFLFAFHLLTYIFTWWYYRINDEIIYPYFYRENRVNIHHFTFTLTQIVKICKTFIPLLSLEFKKKKKKTFLPLPN